MSNTLKTGVLGRKACQQGSLNSYDRKNCTTLNHITCTLKSDVLDKRVCQRGSQYILFKNLIWKCDGMSLKDEQSWTYVICAVLGRTACQQGSPSSYDTKNGSTLNHITIVWTWHAVRLSPQTISAAKY